MTTIYKEKTRCALCGNEKEFGYIGSTIRRGSPDLDTRPPERERSTINTWVQRCPKCGYCASEVSEPRPEAEAVVNGAEYRKQLNDPGYPKLANSFLCTAIIEREAGDYAGATWSLIHAAWVCDDAGKQGPARTCRSKAADMLVTAENHVQQVVEENDVTTMILIELLRRSGRTDDARRVIAERRSGISEEGLICILEFQSGLLEKGDTSCHTISEALGGPK